MEEKDRYKVKHLFNRMAFGIRMEIPEIASFKVAKSLINAEKEFSPIKVTSAGKVQKSELIKLTAEDRRKLLKGRHEELRSLNVAWVNILAEESSYLKEKLAYFWHGHFACRNGIPLYMEDYVNMLRKDALSDFKTLLTEVIKSAAMLQFLNNQQNRKSHPNENFARELLELFTLGRGHYSELDVKEAARAFTGWGFNESGEFEFRERQHDFGEKIFLGEKGNFNGDDIIRIILQQKQCAIFVCTKFWKSFVSDEADAVAIKGLAEVYYNSGYKTDELFNSIMNSEWFYEEKHIGARIKSPIEMIVPFIRDFRLEFTSDTQLLTIQRILGQVLLFPPNVAGWSGGRNWIDSSSLVYRLKLARILLANEVDVIQPKDDGDVNGFAKMTGSVFKQDRMKVFSDWNSVYRKFENLTNPLSDVTNHVIALKDWTPDAELLSKYKVGEGSEGIKSMILHLMSLPEYQLC